MRRLVRCAAFAGAGLLCAACNSGVPEPASVDVPSAHMRLTVIRAATDPFLSRHNLTLKVEGAGGCIASTELFPDTGYAGRRNLYLSVKGHIYIVGQFDARVIDPMTCSIVLSEFRHLDREVVFLGSFDEDGERRWTYFPASVRAERALGTREN